jgi:bacillithiol system protein YtxJ
MTDGLKEITNIEELESALAESSRRPVLIFKHSLTCPISSRAFREFQSHLAQADERVSYNMITVQSARVVSNEAATRLGLRHESPQAILVVDGQDVWSASHYDITQNTLEQAIKNAAP